MTAPLVLLPAMLERWLPFRVRHLFGPANSAVALLQVGYDHATIAIYWVWHTVCTPST